MSNSRDGEAGDQDELMRRWRARIAVQRASTPAPRIGAVSPVEASDPSGQAMRLRQADTLADVGRSLPPFHHLGPLRRAIARVAGRAILYFLRLVTVDQQRFNRLIVEILSAHGAQNQSMEGRLGAFGPQLDALAAQIEALRTALAPAIEAQAARLATVEGRIADAAEQAAAAQQRDGSAVAELRERVALLQTQAEMIRRRVAAAPADAPPAAVPQTPSDVASPPADPRLIAEVLRGSEPDRAARQEQYVPLFAGRTDVLDLGCGRGEFLDLLHAAGVPARGVDRDPDMVLCCREKGHDVVGGDALAYLESLPDQSLGGIFCAQVVEHLRTPDLLRFIELAHRRLRPDGILVIETLNPESLLVLYRWFWVDLTHERLVHPASLRAMLVSCGFRDVAIRYVPPPAGAVRLPPLEVPSVPAERLAAFNAATSYLNDLLYSSFDYAVIATR